MSQSKPFMSTPTTASPSLKPLPGSPQVAPDDGYSHRSNEYNQQHMQFHGATFMNIFGAPGNYRVQTNFSGDSRAFGFGARGSTNKNAYFPGPGRPAGPFGGYGNSGSQFWTENSRRAVNLTPPPTKEMSAVKYESN